MKKALITGITGQDGAYLAEFLLKKGYEVHGIKRRSSSFNTDRVDHLYQDPHEQNVNFRMHYGDLTDSSNLTRIIQLVQPDEIYNLGAQSHVQVSFEVPEYTADMEHFNASDLGEFINLGTGSELRIKELAVLISKVVYEDSPSRTCSIEWDTTKPNGTPRKLLDVSKLTSLGWKANTSLEDGLSIAYKDFLKKNFIDSGETK